MSYITAKEAAEKWNVTLRHVQNLCKSGAIPGAARLGRAGCLPSISAKEKCLR